MVSGVLMSFYDGSLCVVVTLPKDLHMIIAMDIGNTNTSLAVVNGEKVMAVESVKTGLRGCYEKRLTRALRAIAGGQRRAQGNKDAAADEIVICSVVPKALTIAKRCVKKVFQLSPRVVGKDIVVPIDNKYKDPDQVGQDRLLCAYAALRFYGVPAVVVDLGTAMTFDVVTARRGARRADYLGGMIVPGIRLSAEALYEKTALLPQIEIRQPQRLIGRTTQESMLSGIFYGYGEMIRGLIGLLCRQLKQRPRVIVTGGFSQLMRRYVACDDCVVDQNLIFKGMAALCAETAQVKTTPVKTPRRSK